MKYPPGHEPNICIEDENNPLIRYVLGRTFPGEIPLVAVCKNPSFARGGKCDETVRRLIEASEDPTKAHGAHKGWIIVNLWPVQGKPGTLVYDAEVARRNRNEILDVLAAHDVNTVLAAWGGLRKYPMLQRAREDMRETLRLAGATAYTLDPLTEEGEPRHLHPQVGEPLTFAEDQPHFVMDEAWYR